MHHAWMEIARYVSTLKLLRLLDAGVSVQVLLDSASGGDTGHVLMRMAQLYNIYGETGRAWKLMHEALVQRRHFSAEADQAPASLRVLLIVRPGFMLDNTPFDFLIEGTGVACELLYITEDLPLPERLPRHDIVFIGIGHFRRNQHLFERVLPLLLSNPKPAFNLPRSSSSFERDSLSDLLQGIRGVVVPPTRIIERNDLPQLVRTPGLLPLIVRPLRSQAGIGLQLLSRESDVHDYLASRDDGRFYLAPYVDYRSADGLYRKYRLLLLQGVPYACHMAISSHWIVHYRTAGMDESPEKRDEEARFMAEFEQDFCRRHHAALTQIAARIGIDYIVLDCAETPDGQLLFFEADNVSIIHAAGGVDLLPYKQQQMRKVFDAVLQSLQGLNPLDELTAESRQFSVS